MSRKRVLVITAGVAIVLAVISRVASAGSGFSSPIETTRAAAKPKSSPAAASPVTGATPTSAANPVSTPRTAVLTSAEPSAVSPAAKPVLVLNPRTGRAGDSLGVWGSGFPGDALVDLYVKQDLSEVVDPFGFAQADQSGQFGRVSVTVPDMVPRGSLIIEARERQGSASAMAAATVLDGPDNSQVGMNATATPKANATSTPNATATQTAKATSTPKATATPTRKATATPKATTQVQPTPTPTPTPQPERTTASDQSRPSPTAQPQPPAQPTPEPQPVEQPVADTPPTSVSPSSYTIRPGDSLSAIAKQVYGDANAWRAIYDANRGAIGDNPNVIHPGTELVVPAND